MHAAPLPDRLVRKLAYLRQIDPAALHALECLLDEALRLRRREQRRQILDFIHRWPMRRL